MGAKGHTHVATKFSLEAFGESLENILIDILAQKQSLGFYVVVIAAVVLSSLAAAILLDNDNP